MARKPNYRFERSEREKAKAASAEIMEPTRMPSRSPLKYAPLPCSKASPAMNRLIVKPIPQAQPTPIICSQFTPAGKWRAVIVFVGMAGLAI